MDMKNIDIKHIEELITSFYGGTTTLDEEKILLDFFKSENVPDWMDIEQKMFMEIYSRKNEEAPYHLESRLISLVDKLDKEENRTSRPIRKSIHIHWKWVSGIAACIAIMITAGIFLYKGMGQHQEYAVVDTYSDPEDAYRETQKVMLLVSNKLNKGLQQVESIQDNVDRVNKVMNKNNIRL
ncbi:hypothetical protein SAMN05444362_11037 [Dysgonomonas macrotermitis]|uniref:Uncharacterized protein n=2 Tax=Dysgonomonas macrotermitis TaxID=1346286 RepID=A0A1M5EH99_9BACT|nr:hypothetical protein SAMN05444362_11037 [Dysgonomonas macrotermitis]